MDRFMAGLLFDKFPPQFHNYFCGAIGILLKGPPTADERLISIRSDNTQEYHYISRLDASHEDSEIVAAIWWTPDGLKQEALFNLEYANNYETEVKHAIDWLHVAQGRFKSSVVGRPPNSGKRLATKEELDEAMEAAVCNLNQSRILNPTLEQAAAALPAPVSARTLERAIHTLYKKTWGEYKRGRPEWNY
jgi:hypothetical protein